MGSLATERPGEGQIISGVLVKRNFKYQIVDPADISSKLIEFLLIGFVLDSFSILQKHTLGLHSVLIHFFLSFFLYFYLEGGFIRFIWTLVEFSRIFFYCCRFIFFNEF